MSVRTAAGSASSRSRSPSPHARAPTPASVPVEACSPARSRGRNLGSGHRVGRRIGWASAVVACLTVLLSAPGARANQRCQAVPGTSNLQIGDRVLGCGEGRSVARAWVRNRQRTRSRFLLGYYGWNCRPHPRPASSARPGARMGLESSHSADEGLAWSPTSWMVIRCRPTSRPAIALVGLRVTDV